MSNANPIKNLVWIVQMQWQLIPETTMHAFDINALLTIIAINKLTDRTGADPKKFRKWPEADTIFFSQWKNDQCGSKNTHAAVPEKLTINFVWPWDSYKFSLIYSFRASEFTPGFWWGLHCSFFSFLCSCHCIWTITDYCNKKGASLPHQNFWKLAWEANIFFCLVEEVLLKIIYILI
jgi:hypothetical protein